MPQASTPSTFRYLIQDYPTAQDPVELNVTLDNLGAEGWRLIAFGMRDANNSRALFIKEYPGDTAPPLRAAAEPEPPAEATQQPAALDPQAAT